MTHYCECPSCRDGGGIPLTAHEAAEVRRILALPLDAPERYIAERVADEMVTAARERERDFIEGPGSGQPAGILSALDQPPPVKSDRVPVWELVIVDMRERDQVGRARYGTPLQAFNGRDALKDAYAEALDLAVYLRQAIAERDGK